MHGIRVYHILQSKGCIDGFLVPNYDVLHTQGTMYIVEDIQEYLKVRGSMVLEYIKVANDKAFRVVDMYHSGIWDKERAINEIRLYPTYDQIAFITQRAIDQLLRMEFFYEV